LYSGNYEAFRGGRVLVVCNQEHRLRVERTGAIFFDEEMGVEGLNARSLKHNRWGWYFQQIPKPGIAEKVDPGLVSLHNDINN